MGWGLGPHEGLGQLCAGASVWGGGRTPDRGSRFREQGWGRGGRPRRDGWGGAGPRLWGAGGGAVALEEQDGGRLWPSEAWDLIPTHLSSPTVVLIASSGPGPPAPFSTHGANGVPSTHNDRSAPALPLCPVWAERCPLALPPSLFRSEAHPPACGCPHPHVAQARTPLRHVAVRFFSCCVTLFSLFT